MYQHLPPFFSQKRCKCDAAILFHSKRCKSDVLSVFWIHHVFENDRWKPFFSYKPFTLCTVGTFWGWKVEENFCWCILKVGQGNSKESRVPDSAAEKTQLLVSAQKETQLPPWKNAFPNFQSRFSPIATLSCKYCRSSFFEIFLCCKIYYLAWYLSVDEYNFAVNTDCIPPSVKKVRKMTPLPCRKRNSFLYLGNIPPKNGMFPHFLEVEAIFAPSS